MHAVAIVLAASALTVDYGWEQTGDGQLEYIIQIEPPLLEVLKAGGTITSEIDPQVAQVRRFRVRVGRDPVPRELPSTAMDAAGARPIHAPDRPTHTELAPLTLESESDDSPAGPSPPAWSAVAPHATGEETESQSDPSLDLAPDLVYQSDRAIDQPDDARMLDAHFDLAPSNDPGQPPSDVDVPSDTVDRQYSPLRPWNEEAPDINATSPTFDETGRSGADASRLDMDQKVRGVATPAEHYAQTDPYTADLKQRRMRGNEVSEAGMNDTQVAPTGLDDPFGGRREEQPVYDSSVRGTTANEDINRQGNEHDLLERPGQEVRMASADLTKQTQVASGLTSPLQPEATSGEQASTGATRRWLPFLFTLVLLFASCGLNVYLGWITWDTYG